MTLREQRERKMERLRGRRKAETVTMAERLRRALSANQTLRNDLARAKEKWKVFAAENRTLKAQLELLRKRVPSIELRGQVR